MASCNSGLKSLELCFKVTMSTIKWISITRLEDFTRPCINIVIVTSSLVTYIEKVQRGIISKSAVKYNYKIKKVIMHAIYGCRSYLIQVKNTAHVTIISTSHWQCLPPFHLPPFRAWFRFIGCSTEIKTKNSKKQRVAVVLLPKDQIRYASIKNSVQFLFTSLTFISQPIARSRLTDGQYLIFLIEFIEIFRKLSHPYVMQCCQ